MHTFSQFVRRTVVVVVTMVLAASTWLRGRFEDLLLLLPSRPGGRPGRLARTSPLQLRRSSTRVATDG